MKKIVRCICVDDEPLARQGIRLALKDYPDFKLIGEFESADDLLENMPEEIDVVFLDIEMPRTSGFRLLEQWPEPRPLIVFVTAYDKYALKAFENNSLDYILKPIDEDRFAQTISRIKAGQANRADAFTTKKLLQTIDDLKTQLVKSEPEVTVKGDEGYFRLKLSDIIYIEGIGDHVCFHLADRQLITRNTLKKYVSDFIDEDFHQTHKSFLVNARHVSQLERQRFGDFILTMSNDAQVRLSRRYKAAIERLTRN